MDVPDSARDSKTPDEVKVRMEPRVPVFDPTLGIAVNPDRRGRPRNPLVTLGDSFTHGFQSGAIHNTRLSWPKIVAWEMGADDAFRFPLYDGFGGLPLNIEYVLREMEQRFGDRIDWWESARAVFHLRQLMAQIEDFWERGPGAVVPNRTKTMHNLAVYGWDLRDALGHTFDTLRNSLVRPSDNVLSQIVEGHNARAALRVYTTCRDEKNAALTVFQAAEQLGAMGARPGPDGGASDHGIETLAVMLGGNNALPTVLKLKVRWSMMGYDDLDQKSEFTVWCPSHFASEFAEVVAAVKKIKARHVIFGTVPHVTIAPIARGVGGKVRESSRYFPYYTRPWIDDRRFDPKDDPCLTECEARAIDSAIDQYNDTITLAVKQARTGGLDWYLLDLAGVLDRLAARRYSAMPPQHRPAWWTPYELPPELAALDPKPDSRFFASGPGGRTQGGLISLDGVHPTTAGYGILAQEVIQVMQRAGVRFYLGDEVTERVGPVRVDFHRLLAHDTLLRDPPRSLSANLALLGWLDETADVFKRVLTGQ